MSGSNAATPLSRAGRRRGGFTLVELMVGLALGLFVSVVAVSLFVSTRKLQSVNASSNRMSESARLAFDLLHRDLRLAGFRGCSATFDRPITSMLNNSAGAFIDDVAGMRGYRGTGSGFSPALPTALSSLTPAPRNNSDILSVRVPVDAVSLGLEATMASNTAAPNVGTSAGSANLIGVGDVVMISNCKSAGLFQVTGPGSPATTGLLTRAIGTSPAPGNANTDLGVRYNKDDTAVYRVQTRHYYVAPSAAPSRAGTYSLWRLTVPAPAGGAAAEEIVAGIERLDISYGVDMTATADRSADRYMTADTLGADWSNVVSARIQMLTATTADGTAQSASSVAFAGGTVNAGDRRLREVYSEVVAFRNQVK